jgi:hypothetical protein
MSRGDLDQRAKRKKASRSSICVESRLPPGLSPRLLIRDAAAAYLSISSAHFTAHVASAVPPVAIGAALRWDIKALDRWLDQLAGIRNDPGSRERLLEDL